MPFQQDAISSQQDAVREYALNVGRENPDREWILSHYDTWERNPFYSGPPGRHPEDDHEGDSPPEDDAQAPEQATECF